MPNAFTTVHRQPIILLSVRYALPAAYPYRYQAIDWTIWRNVQFDIRWATAKATEIRRHAAELAALAPDVILAHGASTVGPMLQATRAVPIVFPLASELEASE